MVAGVLLILVAAAQLLGRKVQWHPRRTHGRDADHSGALLVKQNASASTNVLVILGFNVIQFGLIELPLLGRILAPDRTRATYREAQQLDDHRRMVIVFLAGAIGAYLLILGVSDLS